MSSPFLAQRDAALYQLAAVPGVVGSLVFDRTGAVLASAFPPVFDAEGLSRLAGQLSSDAFFQDWVSGDASLALRYGDGQVMVRSAAASWVLVLCAATANEPLLAMSLTQVVRRLRAAEAEAASRTPAPAPAPAPAPPGPVERLRAIVQAELGEHAAQALEILAAAGSARNDLLRSISEVEKLVRLFISKRRAEELARQLRDSLDA